MAYIKLDEKKFKDWRRSARMFQDDIVCAIGTDFMEKIAEAENAMIFDILSSLESEATDAVVETKAIEQLKWERDTAIKQLNSYGVGFCEKADVVKVNHGEWTRVRTGTEEYGMVYYQHKECKVSSNELFNRPYEYCPRCGVKMSRKQATR